MGIVTVTTFTSPTETVTDTKLNGLAGNLVTEFNGNIDNANIKAGANIAGSKLDLSTPGAIGGTTPAAGAFTTLSTTGAFSLGGKLTAGANEIEGSNFDINGGDISAGTISGSLTWSAAQNLNNQNLTNVDIDSGAIDGAVIGGASAAAITGTTLKANTSLELASGATVTAVLDEDAMGSDSATALATQQSIKAYVDNSTPAGSSTASFNVRINTNFGVSNGSWGQVTGFTEVFDTGSDFASDTFTVPNTGKYLFTFSGSVKVTSGTDGFQVRIAASSAGNFLLGGGLIEKTDFDNQAVGGAVIVSLTASETVTLQAQATSANSQIDSDNAWWTGTLLA